ncbi:FHA domain-containing protein FhaB/FipA [Actinobaculum suis]|uniref:FHA domain-containing protein FhaB/FipA n=1 Tax=Actinobaculum suis TaxID=1657 RepID=UPI00080876B0|nr:FHA domain-containing protein [Actinobaculum suis]OCA95094.1 hypothetical protein ACU20_04765 [Actinobaculum suis]OCA95716.1 hypothetical protein ACU21_03345 [Actinobaculum suis]
MNLLLTLLRFGFLIFLWLFVLGVVLVVRNDTSGLAIRSKKPSRRGRRAARQTENATSDLAAGAAGAAGAAAGAAGATGAAAGAAGAAGAGAAGVAAGAGAAAGAAATAGAAAGVAAGAHAGARAGARGGASGHGPARAGGGGAGTRGAGSRPVLAVIEGPLTGMVLPLGQAQIIIGRSPDSSLVLDDSYASSRHARVFFQDGYWWIEDLQSTNGTYIGNSAITEPVALVPGTRVRIGKTTMELQI